MYIEKPERRHNLEWEESTGFRPVLLASWHNMVGSLFHRTTQ
jgi:hypothetical protein